MTKNRVKQFLPHLEALARIKARKNRHKFIDSCGEGLVKSICECSANVLHGNLQITDKNKNKLKKYKKDMRKLALKSKSLSSKKRLIQKGGFLLPLLGAVLPALASTIGGMFRR